jgi:hypothetical protein
MLTLFVVIAMFPQSGSRGYGTNCGPIGSPISWRTRNAVLDMLGPPQFELAAALLSSPGSLLQPGQRDHPRGSA